MSPTPTLHLPSREVGAVTLMPHPGREDRNLTQGRFLAEQALALAAGLSLRAPGTFALTPLTSRCHCVEAPSLTGKFTASSLLPLITGGTLSTEAQG